MDVSPSLSTWGPGISYSRLLRHKIETQMGFPNRSVECDLCASWALDTPTSIVFRIRENVRWHDLEPVYGRTLNSNDIAFSYLRQSDPESPNSPLMRNIKTIEPVSPLEIQITLKSQDSDFLNAISDGHSKIVAKEAVMETGDLRAGPTIGTGPWVLETSEPTSIHEFSRNPQYFETGLPLIDAIKLHVLPDPPTRSAAFAVGLLDIHQMEVPEWRKYVAETPTAPVLLVKEPANGLEFGIKSAQPPFDDPRIRQAVFLALDPWKAIEEHWGGFAFISPGFQLAELNWLLNEKAQRRFLNLPDKARTLLNETGVTLPIPVTITLGDFGEEYLAHANSINVELTAVGFAPEVKIVDRRFYGQNVWLGGEYQIFVGPTAPINTPNGYLLPVLHSEGAWNTTEHIDLELDAMLEKQATMLDAEARRLLTLRIQEQVLRQAYRFMPAARISIWAWTPRTRNFYPNFAGFEYIHWSRIWLED